MQWVNKQTLQTWWWGWGSGDMTKAVYDVNDSWYVDSAHKILLPFINKLGSTVTKGTIVVIKSSSASVNFPEIIKANASTEAYSSKTVGAVYEDVVNDATGYLVTNGEVDNLDTSSYSVGDSLWLSTTDGLVTTTQPSAPNHSVYIGRVTRSQATNGRIHYDIQNWYELWELHDVSFTSLANDDFIQRKAGLWQNRTIAQVKTDLALTKSDVGLSNVDNTSDLNKPISTATQTALDGKANTSHTHTLANVTDVTMTVANLNSLDDWVNSTLHFHNTDRDRANHTGTQASTTISDFTEASQDSVGAMVDSTLTYNDATPSLWRAALTGAITASAWSNATALGSFTVSQLNTAISDADVATWGGTATWTNTWDQSIFSTIAVSGQSNVVADTTSDTLTLVAGTNVTITTNATTDEITISASGGGGGSPWGSNTQVQFNDSGAFGWDAWLTYNKTTDTLNVLWKLWVWIANSGSATIEAKSFTTWSIQWLRIEGDNIGNTQFSTFLTWDAFTRFSFLTDGRLKWSSWSWAPDTELYRSWANELRTPDKLVVDSGIQIGTSSTVWYLWTATDTSWNGSWQAAPWGWSWLTQAQVLSRISIWF